jgi:hypothetical protein
MRARPWVTLCLGQAALASQLPTLLAGKLFLPGLPIPLHRAAVASSLGLMVAVLWVASGAWMAPAVARRASAFSLFVSFLLAYPAFAKMTGAQPYTMADTCLAIAYLVALPGGVWLALYAWRNDIATFSSGVALLVAVLAGTIWFAGWNSYAFDSARWEGIVQSVSVPLALGPGSASDPDILHVVMDALGSADTLQSEFGITNQDLSPLRNAGLGVASNATANYAYTYQAIASTLNMTYLDGLSGPLWDVKDRRPLVSLVERSSVARSLRERGYKLVFAGSGFDVTPDSTTLPEACINCGPAVPGLFETALLSNSPLRALGLWDLMFDAHRGRIADTVKQLTTLPPGDERPRFIFAHLMVPHPPFLAGPDGALTNPRRAFEILDETLYRGSKDEYRGGYRAQALFALREVARIVQRVRTTRHRELVVIVHGDHGPGLRFDPDRLTPAGLRERLTILLASSWPDNQPHPELRSPVNIYRVVFNTCFKFNFPLLPDRSLLSDRNLPYRASDVTADLWQSSPAAH